MIPFLSRALANLKDLGRALLEEAHDAVAQYVAAHVEEHPTIAAIRDEVIALRAKSSSQKPEVEDGYYLLLPKDAFPIMYREGNRWRKCAQNDWPFLSGRIAVRLDR